MKIKSIIYWTATAILAFALVSGGAGQVAHAWGTLETVTVLGYPAYFVTIIGLWKILGGIAILLPRFPLLKEWAYAGIFFEMTGAAASHAFAGDYGNNGFHLIAPLLLAILAVISWALRPASRRVAN
jgi:uncharacterized membrane protein YphA (DoxX/SURF4 family)